MYFYNINTVLTVHLTTFKKFVFPFSMHVKIYKLILIKLVILSGKVGVLKETGRLTYKGITCMLEEKHSKNSEVNKHDK